jgi:very-short-patch-repair endonuclease
MRKNPSITNSYSLSEEGLFQASFNSLSLEGRGQGEGDKKGLNRLARTLRKTSTDVERLLWSRLRAGRCEGVKVRRQHPIGKYIVDFVCLERKLVIELDGGQHALPEEIRKDKERDAWLEKEGYVVVRFWDSDVLENLDGVLEVIRRKLFK